MAEGKKSLTDRLLARVCALCPVCRLARRHPHGTARRFVKRVEGRLCPFCRAHARVHAPLANRQKPDL